jgi:hypothetical protein
MKTLFIYKKSLVLTIVGIIAPFLASVSLAQPPDPPPPPVVASIEGAALAIIILVCVGYGAYNIYRQNNNNEKVAEVAHTQVLI